MKQLSKLKIWMTILLPLFIIGSCMDDDFEADRMAPAQSNDDGRFTIAEAKQAFESHYAAACQSSCGPHTKADDMSDDDFTPLWDVAVSRHQDSCSFMTVPIATHKLLRIADIRNGKEHPKKLAIVKEEMHFIKNYALNTVIPTMKTIIPLDGSDVTVKGYSPKNALYIYRLLSGEVLNYQLIRNGREVFHTYAGEEQFSYEAKMKEIDHDLDGLSLLMSQVYTFGGENESEVIICGFCGGSHPYTYICSVSVTSCPKCHTQYYPDRGVHYCPPTSTTCGRCGASYNPSYGHSCPAPNYCNVCQQSYTGYHYCNGPSPSRCNSCGQYYVGSHNCPGPGRVCTSCHQYYVGSHTCPNLCAICGTTPCKSKCSTCGKNHCSTDHNSEKPVITGNPKLQKSIDDILRILKDSPLAKTFLSYNEKNRISFVPKEGQKNIVLVEIYVFSDGTLGFKINYNPSEINKASELSLNTITIHELYHFYTTDKNGIITNPNNPLANNERDHYNMVNDPDYVTWMKKAIPGHTDDFYNNLRYSGTKGSPVYQNLSKTEQRKLRIFFQINKLKNQ